MTRRWWAGFALGLMAGLPVAAALALAFDASLLGCVVLGLTCGCVCSVAGGEMAEGRL